MGRLATFAPFIWGTGGGMYQYPRSDDIKVEHDYLNSHSTRGALGFAERADGSPRGSGDGPFFSAKFYDRAHSAKVVTPTGLAQIYERGVTYYYSHPPFHSYFVGRSVVQNGIPGFLLSSVHYYDDSGDFRDADQGFFAYREFTYIPVSGFPIGCRYNPYAAAIIPWEVQRESPQAALQYLDHHPDYGRMNQYYNSPYLYLQDYIPPKDERSELAAIPLKYGEHDFYVAHANELFRGGALAYMYAPLSGISTSGFSRAYQDAYDRLPRLTSNTIANLMDLARTIISLRDGIDLSELRSLRKMAKDAWLGYRYSYGTTLSDIRELDSCIDRWNSLVDALKVTSYGQYTDHDGRTYHCAIELSPTIAVGKWGKRYDLNLSLENAWDMVPYSFIIDWFTGISDLLHGLDTWLDGDIATAVIWYSMTHQYESEDGTVSVFFRFRGDTPSLPYWKWDWSHKGKTWAMRVTDALALLSH